ncbi:hypothetical protein L0F63_002067 [Massospora cicadina]|nr:hypothetical protein L0F63_002067 [Massospora cicadina]
MLSPLSWSGTITASIPDKLSDELDELLDRNRHWASSTSYTHPKLFSRLAKTQAPKILWIGCSDSRVPETEIFRANPGDFFVHRNIANIVHEDDASINSVLQYSVEVLQVQHIIVCGHYCCGGVKAALDPPDLNLVKEWIKPICDLYEVHKAELDPSKVGEERAWRTLVHYNVQKSIEAIKRHPSVAASLSSETPLKIHHWVYDVATGLIVKTNFY